MSSDTTMLIKTNEEYLGVLVKLLRKVEAFPEGITKKDVEAAATLLEQRPINDVAGVFTTWSTFNADFVLQTLRGDHGIPAQQYCLQHVLRLSRMDTGDDEFNIPSVAALAIIGFVRVVEGLGADGQALLHSAVPVRLKYGAANYVVALYDALHAHSKDGGSQLEWAKAVFTTTLNNLDCGDYTPPNMLDGVQDEQGLKFDIGE